MNVYQYFVIGVGWSTMTSVTTFSGLRVETLFGRRRNSTALNCEQHQNNYKNRNSSLQQEAIGEGRNYMVLKTAQATKRSGHSWRWRWQRRSKTQGLR